MTSRTSRSDWRRLRKRVLTRDHWTCTGCGQVGGRLEVHHVRKWAESQDDSEDNLVTVCAKCHIAKHRNDRSKQAQEWDQYLLTRYGRPLRYEI